MASDPKDMPLWVYAVAAVVFISALIWLLGMQQSSEDPYERCHALYGKKVLGQTTVQAKPSELLKCIQEATDPEFPSCMAECTENGNDAACEQICVFESSKRTRESFDEMIQCLDKCEESVGWYVCSLNCQT